jgi:hypothetical protein
MPANGKSNGRFELPVFAPLDSLTKGTDIPPPPDSPIEEKAPPLTPADVATPINGEAGAATVGDGVYSGRGRTSTTDVPPLSPASSTRPSSIRRFLSRKSLNANYTNGTNHNGSQENLSPIGVARPDSPSSFSVDGRPGLAKKSGSWFRRLGSSSEKKRTSIVYEKPQEKQVSMGPPPPKLPELNQLKAKVEDDDAGSLGGEEMFKNIK